MTETKHAAQHGQNNGHKSKAELKAMIEKELKFEPFDFEAFELQGIPVKAKNIPLAPCIHMEIGFHYGAIHDEPGKEGTAHFLEHMIFDGSSMFADEKETQEFGKTVMLDTLNAYTGMFELFITGKTLPHNFNLALQGIFSMIIEPKLTQKSWDHEQKVITQEAWGKFLNEKRVAYIRRERENTMYDIPDRLRTASALGWPETIMQITHEDIINAHKRYFVRENMELYIVGNIDAIGGLKALKQKLDEFLIKMPSSADGNKAREPFIPDNIGNPKQLMFDHTYEQIGLSSRQQSSLSLSTTIPRTVARTDHEIEKQEAHLAALDLTSKLLADLVFRRLRLENSWCYGAGAGACIKTDYLGFNMGGSIDPAHVDEAVGILWNIVDEVQKGEDEIRADFEKTKQLAIDNLMARELTSSKILEEAVENVKLNGSIMPLKKWLLRLADIEFEDVQEVVRIYLAKEKVFTEIVRP